MLPRKPGREAESDGEQSRRTGEDCCAEGHSCLNAFYLAFVPAVALAGDSQQEACNKYSQIGRRCSKPQAEPLNAHSEVTVRLLHARYEFVALQRERAEVTEQNLG